MLIRLAESKYVIGGREHFTTDWGKVINVFPFVWVVSTRVVILHALSGVSYYVTFYFLSFCCLQVHFARHYKFHRYSGFFSLLLFHPLKVQIFFSVLVLKHSQVFFLSLKFHTRAKEGNTIVSCILIFTFLDRAWRYERFWMETAFYAVASNWNKRQFLFLCTHT